MKIKNLWTLTYEDLLLKGNDDNQFSLNYVSPPEEILDKLPEFVDGASFQDEGVVYKALDGFIASNSARSIFLDSAIYLTVPFNEAPEYTIKITKHLETGIIYLNIHRSDFLKNNSFLLGMFNFSLNNSHSNTHAQTTYQIAYKLKIPKEQRTRIEGVKVCNGLINTLLLRAGDFRITGFYELPLNLNKASQQMEDDLDDNFLFLKYGDLKRQLLQLPPLSSETKPKKGTVGVSSQDVQSKIFYAIKNFLLVNHAYRPKHAIITRPILFSMLYRRPINNRYSLKVSEAIYLNNIALLEVNVLEAGKTIADVIFRPNLLSGNMIEAVTTLYDPLEGKELFSPQGVNILNYFLANINFYDGYVKLPKNNITYDFTVLSRDMADNQSVDRLDIREKKENNDLLH